MAQATLIAEFCLVIYDGYGVRSLIESYQYLLDILSFTITNERLVFFHTYPDLITQFSIPLLRMVPGIYAYETAKSYQITLSTLIKNLKNCTKGKILTLYAYQGDPRLRIQITGGEAGDSSDKADIEMVTIPTIQIPNTGVGELYEWKNSSNRHIVTVNLQDFINRLKGIVHYKSASKWSIYRKGFAIKPFGLTVQKEDDGHKVVEFGSCAFPTPLYIITVSEDRVKWFTKFAKVAKTALLEVYLPPQNYGILHMTIIVSAYASYDISILDTQ